MSLVVKIQALCEIKGATLIGLEREIGIGRGTIRRWDESSPTIEKIQKVADYFHVSVDYLLGRDDKDQKDIAKAMEKIKCQLMIEDGLMFDGEILHGEAKTLLIEDIEREIRIIKMITKKWRGLKVTV